MRSLAIVERAYRGGVESQFFDALYSAVELNRQLGGLDILLRGMAVTYAVETGPVEPPRFGGETVDTVNDPRKGLRDLLAADVGVWVEEPDLAALRLTGTDRLAAGVRTAEAGEMAARWPEYRLVFFL